MRLKIGCDPEFFLTRKGVPVSAHDIVPGTKEAPHPLTRGAVQADGTAVEFNIQPATNGEEFAHNIARTLMEVRMMIPREFDFHFYPVVEYPQKEFRKYPLYARRLGCDPDFNAYKEGERNPTPRAKGTLRTAAGHIHLGWGENLPLGDDQHLRDCIDAVQQLDRVLAKVEPTWCDDRRRREVYGARGAFRPKPYGVEYRVLSNSWLRYPKLWPWLFDVAKQSLTDLYDGELLLSLEEPKFQKFAFMRNILPFRYPRVPEDITEEKEPWHCHL